MKARGSILVCCPLVDRCAGLVDRRTAFAEKGCRADVFVAVAVGQVANRQSVHGLMAVAVHQHEVVLFTNTDFQAASIAFVILGPPGVWVGAVVAGRYALPAALVSGGDAQHVRFSLQRPWRAGRRGPNLTGQRWAATHLNRLRKTLLFSWRGTSFYMSPADRPNVQDKYANFCLYKKIS